MKTTKWVFLLILLITPYVSGMGSMTGDTFPEKIPIPNKKYTVTYIDQNDVVTECREASIEGATLIEGKRGSGRLAVPFENISHVVFHFQNGNLHGKLKLRDNTTLDIILQKNQNAYGRTKYGTFQIKLSDLKKLIIHESSSSKTP